MPAPCLSEQRHIIFLFIFPFFLKTIFECCVAIQLHKQIELVFHVLQLCSNLNRLIGKLLLSRIEEAQKNKQILGWWETETEEKVIVLFVSIYVSFEDSNCIRPFEVTWHEVDLKIGLCVLCCGVAIKLV
jgi:hypothetical protein